ncbi:MAG: glycosyltransferase family 25 protein [Verrucomicrobia bacterium]|nr:glycosyltransferase family 25 protein [Verrucomicrobiota bacterium]
MLTRIIFLLCLCFSPLFAGIEQYFKKAEGKSSVHRMRNIDFIYLINLDQRPEKYEQSIQELAPYGIIPYRFSAVNGWEELTYEALNDLGVKYQRGMRATKGTSYFPEDNGQPQHSLPMQNYGQTYFAHCLSWGAIGCCMSHLSVLQDAYHAGYETIWVIEDDIQIIRDPHTLSNLIDQLDRAVGKGRWDILYTDRDTKNKEGNYVPCRALAQRPNFTPRDPQIYKLQKRINSDLRQIGARYGTYSMIIRRSGMKKILDFLKTYHLFLPIDLEIPLVPGIRQFTVTQDVVSTWHNAATDNGNPNYLNK